MMKDKPAKVAAVTAIGALIFFLCARFLTIPSPLPNLVFGIQYGIQAFLAVFYGPIAACVSGMLGHLLTDLSSEWGIWWSWIIGTGLFGLLLGLAAERMNLTRGKSQLRELLYFNAAQILVHCICWSAVVPLLDLILYHEAVERVFLHGLVGALGNTVATALVGTILCYVHIALTRAKREPVKE